MPQDGNPLHNQPIFNGGAPMKPCGPMKCTWSCIRRHSLRKCHLKQWVWIIVATGVLMVGRVAVGNEPNDEAELRILVEQMQAYGEPTGDPQHPTPRERSLEADLAVMHDRAVTAEAALATCQAEVTTLKEAP